MEPFCLLCHGLPTVLGCYIQKNKRCVSSRQDDLVFVTDMKKRKLQEVTPDEGSSSKDSNHNDDKKQSLSTSDLQLVLPIKLNIGGQVFLTLKDTLTSIEGSYFASVFSPHFAEPITAEDGSYFVDRDPTDFKIILNHLRGKNVSAAIKCLDKSRRQSLIEECKFYGLDESMGKYFKEILLSSHLEKRAGSTFKTKMKFKHSSVVYGVHGTYDFDKHYPSHDFSAFGIKWCCDFKGTKAGKSLSMFLTPKKLYGYAFKLKCSFNMDSEDDGNTFTHEYRTEDEGWGYPSFVQVKDLRDERDHYMIIEMKLLDFKVKQSKTLLERDTESEYVPPAKKTKNK
ncbi:SH3KBP1-binding protein [Acrasis kona]|uniref:SH3KBP1-binding protein n=1 Tax=Acrasis kona TaxID=1008807 RepID=A0AAW2Z8K6_9EUKA